VKAVGESLVLKFCSNVLPSHFPGLILEFEIFRHFIFTGSFGGIRTATILRSFVAELRMLPIPSAVVIPEIRSAITEEGIVKEERISRNVGKQLDELGWFATAIQNHSAVEPCPGSS